MKNKIFSILTLFCLFAFSFVDLFAAGSRDISFKMLDGTTLVADDVFLFDTGSVIKDKIKIKNPDFIPKDFKIILGGKRLFDDTTLNAHIKKHQVRVLSPFLVPDHELEERRRVLDREIAELGVEIEKLEGIVTQKRIELMEKVEEKGKLEA